MMKKFYLIAFSLLFMNSGWVMAQNNASKADDSQRIAITPQVDDQNIPQSAKSMLEGKMKQICTKNGLSGDGDNPFFVMNVTIDVLSKELTPTAPPMHALNLQVNFTISDNLNHNVYSETSIEVKGVGQNETKAYMAGLKNINPSSGQFKAMVDKGKEKILEFYNSQCDFVISKAKALQTQGNNRDAIKVLNSVPPVCKECYDQCMQILATIEPPADEPVAQASTDASGGGASEGTYEVEIDNNIFLIYKNSKVLGNKLMLYFELQNRGTKDYELKDYAYDTRITDENGAEHKVEQLTAGGDNSSYYTVTILPGVPVKMECQFPNVDKVTMFEYKYMDKIFRLKDIMLTPASGSGTVPVSTAAPVPSAPAQTASQPAPSAASPMLVGDAVLASFTKENFYRKRYLPSKVQTVASAATKGETQLIVINDEVPSNSWTTDILTKWHMVAANELHDGSVVIYTDDATPDIKSTYYPGVVVMTDELYKGIVSVKGRWGDINKVPVKQIAIVDAPQFLGPTD